MAIKDMVNKQRDYYYTESTKTYKFRKDALKKLYDAVSTYEDEIKEALYKDLNKSAAEAYLTEIGVTLKEIKYLSKNLKKFMKRKKRKTEITNFPAKSFISPHPYGVTLIMSPWNYPIYLTLAPLAGAISAGNTAIIKPSNYSSNTSDVIEKMIQDTFDNEYISVVKGGREKNQDLLNRKFDYIFFTGSTTVGKIVMEKASRNLTPISLELGGKSPTIVTKDSNIDLSAKRIIFGKLINSGQTCVAPDYVLIDEEVEEEFIGRCMQYINQFFGKKPLENEKYGKIINKKHYDRLVGLMKDQEIVVGGKTDAKQLKIEPTVLRNVSPDSPIMQEEIFGPILPIMTYKDINEAIDFIQKRPHPLALYLFTKSKDTINKVLNQCQFGGGCINDTIMQVASDYLPFGGVGDSGIGQYHGKASFDTFTHYRSVIKKSTLIDIPLRYQPLSDMKIKMIKKVLK
ncbi:MAG: aldehyde dehydrogenase [Tenericutes bacterium]|jgi:aldehyde dehydrogenase (NAD+)|nr:aldehyde dehydrogenase [Mycoplasmatota bacterium]